METDKWARENPEFKRLTEQAIYARYKSPYTQIQVFMGQAREAIRNSTLQGDMLQYLHDVLDGKVIPK